ncbi:MAG: ParB/RepB/Spo0J family partition protein [Ignavibacteriaceae bacterium]|jgi:ParB family chromosome partitioning protein
MNKMRTGLGRGLDALLKPSTDVIAQPQELEINSGKNESLLRIKIENIFPNPFQPRMHFDQGALDELKASIFTNGLIQPITVRKFGEGQFQIVSGERRLRACKEIGLIDIPAYIIEVLSDDIMLSMAIIENIQREKLNPIEVGLAFKRLMEECSLTQEQIAERVGKDRTTVANSIRLLKLPQEIQDALIHDEISMGHARALINLPSHTMQLEALKRIKENSLSVRKVESLVKKMLTETSTQKKILTLKTPGGISNSASLLALEDKLRKIFGTKVICKVKQDGTGDVTIEFYSSDELERLIDLFDLIEKNYN